MNYKKFKYDQYKLIYETQDFKKKLKKSKNKINEFMQICRNPYIAWSGGKDSTALVYLITQDCGFKDMLIFCQKDDCDFPGEKNYIKRLTKKYNLNTEIYEPDISMWNYIINNKVDLMASIHSKNNEITKKFFISCINRFLESHPEVDGYFMGLRAGESRGRKMNYLKRGHIYFKKSEKLFVCNPLSDWTVKDVFAYLVGNNIEILPVYTDITTVEEAENIRKSWWIPSGDYIHHGSLLVLKMKYPKLYFKIIQVYPELQRFA